MELLCRPRPPSGRTPGAAGRAARSTSPRCRTFRDHLTRAIGLHHRRVTLASTSTVSPRSTTPVSACCSARRAAPASSAATCVVVCTNERLLQRFALTGFDRAVAVGPHAARLTLDRGRLGLGPRPCARRAGPAPSPAPAAPPPGSASSATSRFMLSRRVGSSVPVVDRCVDRAARLLLVLAVAEPAVVHQVEHVGERPLDAAAAAPQADRTHAGRVDQPAVAGQADQLGRRGGVAAALVAFAHHRRGLPLVTDQRVHERALADAARAEQRDRRVAGGVARAAPRRPRR